jgi:AcrR family transcriptional regulator
VSEEQSEQSERSGHLDEADGPAPGRRRERHKSRTRAALVDAALELFAEKGYDSTTTGEIASHAGVAPRTFFRYFESKEHVLFFGLEDYLGDLGSVFVAQPAESGDVEALCDSFLALSPRLVAARPRYRRYRRAVESSATLRGRHLDFQRQLQAGIADGLARRRGLAAADVDCRLVASLFASLIEQTIEEWMAAEDDVELAVVFASALQALRRVAPSDVTDTRPNRRVRPWVKPRRASATAAPATTTHSELEESAQ